VNLAAIRAGLRLDILVVTKRHGVSPSLAAWIITKEVNLNELRANLWSLDLTPKPNATLLLFSQTVTHAQGYSALQPLVSSVCILF
jgi:hypothetical protein